MPRAIWTGAIRFGLVNIPVTLTAAIEPHRVSFHEFERGTNQRIHLKRVAERSGEEVPWEKIEKGYEIAKGRYVMLTDEEIEAAEPEKSHAIDIETFVPLDEIDPVAWDKAYYVAPDGDPAAKAYGLLREAMRQQERVAIGRFVLRTKEYVVCVRPLERILALHTMYYPDEVRATKELPHVPARTAGGKELALAEQLVTAMSGHWDPKAHQDTFSARVRELVRKKDQGHEIVAAPGKTEPGKVIDLMEALKATLAGKSRDREKASGGKPSKTKAARRTVARRRTAHGGR